MKKKDPCCLEGRWAKLLHFYYFRQLTNGRKNNESYINLASITYTLELAIANKKSKRTSKTRNGRIKQLKLIKMNSNYQLRNNSKDSFFMPFRFRSFLFQFCNIVFIFCFESFRLLEVTMR
jgi:hypothetical protein